MQKPYKEERRNEADKYLSKGMKGKGKGKIRNTIPPNQLKHYIARSQHIQSKSNDEYASESNEEIHEPPIGTSSPISSDANTILYADYQDDKEFLVIQMCPFLAIQAVRRQ